MATMTALRKDAMKLVENAPEEQLYFIVQFLQGTDIRHRDEIQDEKRKAFTSLEKIRKKVPDLDYDKELARYREERYGARFS